MPKKWDGYNPNRLRALLMDFEWKYRVVRRSFRNPHEKIDTIAFSIYEVYRDEKGNIAAVAAKESDPSGETADELKADMAAMIEAFQLPVLDYGQITEEIAQRRASGKEKSPGQEV